jgi:hypothetical protein
MPQYDNSGNIISDYSPGEYNLIGMGTNAVLTGVGDVLGAVKTAVGGVNYGVFKTVQAATNAYYKPESDLIKRQNNFEEPDIKQRPMSYPISDKGNHYVKFWINLDEESKLIRDNKVVTTGTVDYTDQNRMNQGTATKSSTENVATVAGAIAGASAALTYIPAAIKKFTGNDIFKGKSIGSSAKIGAIIAGTGAVVGGVGVGGVLVANQERFKLNKRLKRLATSISLYTPTDISTSYNMGWSMTDDKLIDFAQSKQQEALLDSLANRPLETASKGLRIALSASSEAFSNLGRTAVNPKKDMLFQNVDNRSFSFNYVFAPRSKQEAQEVADIIYTFKLFAHPELLEGYAQYLYLYPAEFDIEYRMIDGSGKDIENPFINKISTCVLQSIDVVYAPNGSFQSLANGEPVMTTMRLSFKEIETLHQDKIKQGF